MLVEVSEQVDTGRIGAFPDGDGKAEPRWIAVCRCFRQDQEFLGVRQIALQEVEIAFAPARELPAGVELRQPARRLHVGDLEIVA